MGAGRGEPAFDVGCSVAGDELVLPLPRPLDPIGPPLEEGRSRRFRAPKLTCPARCRELCITKSGHAGRVRCRARFGPHRPREPAYLPGNSNEVTVHGPRIT